MVVKRSADIDLQFFKDALDSMDGGRVHLALKHLINFYETHHIVEAASEVEYGLVTPDNSGIRIPTIANSRVLQGFEGRPGVTVYERRVTPWVERPPVTLYKDGELPR